MGKHATLERKKKRKAKGLKGPDGSQAGRLAKRAAQRAGDGRLVIVRAKLSALPVSIASLPSRRPDNPCDSVFSTHGGEAWVRRYGEKINEVIAGVNLIDAGVLQPSSPPSAMAPSRHCGGRLLLGLRYSL